MKKLLLALSLFGLTAFAAAPAAKADDHYGRRNGEYDHHHGYGEYHHHQGYGDRGYSGHPGYRHRHYYWRHGVRYYYYGEPYGYPGYYGPAYSPGVSVHIGL